MSQARHALTIFYVADLTATAAFYDAAFAFEKSVNVPEYVEYILNAGARLGLMPQGNTLSFLGAELAARKPTDACPRGELYLHVDELEPAIARLKAAGAECTSPLAERDWGDRAAYFLDLDGYVIAVAQPITTPPATH